MIKRLINKFCRMNTSRKTVAGGIPLHCGFMEQTDVAEVVNWGWFLYKAAKGSYKAEEWQRDSQRATLLKLTNNPAHENRDGVEFYAPLKKFFDHLDFAGKPEAIVDEMLKRRWIDQKIRMNSKPFHDHHYYQALWKREITVSEKDLQHDAILELAENWSLDEYRKRMERLCEESPEYNSLDAGTCMIFSAIVYPEDTQQSI